MRRPRVLHLGTYPIEPRIHGGQRRVGAILDAYRRAGIDSKYVAVYCPLFYPDVAVPDGAFAIREVFESLIARLNPWYVHFVHDLLLGDGFCDVEERRERLIGLWARFGPDAVQLEQPYLWPIVKRLFESGRVPRVPLIYSSQNVETVVKERVCAGHLSQEETREDTRRVLALEAEVCRQSALTVAVTAPDAEQFRRMGARQCVVARNGGDVRRASPRHLVRWHARLLRNRYRAFAVYVSSGYPPNYAGLEQLVGTELSYLPPDRCLVLAGGIANLARQFPPFRPSRTLNESRIQFLTDDLTDEDLAAILSLARAVLLPITAASGSNLKTVEALLSGRPVIATTAAFRSYEEYMRRERVLIRDDPLAFRKAIQDELTAPEPDAAKVEPEPDLQALTWQAIGDNLARVVLNRGGILGRPAPLSAA